METKTQDIEAAKAGKTKSTISTWNDSPTFWDHCRKLDKKLSPCPFCGSRAVVEFLLHPPTKSFWAECDLCGAKTDIALTGEEAVDLWNTRHQSSKPSVSGDAVREVTQHQWTTAENIGSFFWWCPECDKRIRVDPDRLNNRELPTAEEELKVGPCSIAAVTDKKLSREEVGTRYADGNDLDNSVSIYANGKLVYMVYVTPGHAEKFANHINETFAALSLPSVSSEWVAIESREDFPQVKDEYLFRYRASGRYSVCGWNPTTAVLWGDWIDLYSHWRPITPPVQENK